AVLGATVLTSLQVAAILSYGTISRFAFLQSDTLVTLAPAVESVFWWPARAILGDPTALVAVLGVGGVLLIAVIAAFSPWLGDNAIAASNVADSPARRQHRALAFRHVSPKRTLRRKEWTLLRRDPWLVSQTLMQILYLFPPALMLWRGYGDGGVFAVLVPVLVMAAGQLAGGLAWLAISGEDAPDLVATAPVPAGFLVRAKIEGVLGAVAIVFAPLLAALALIAPFQALVAAIGMAIAVIAATLIQLWFRNQ